MAAFAGCGDEAGSDERLVISAASSLKPAFGELRGPRYSFAGSDELAAQIRRGVRPDVFAAANTRLPAALHREGLVERPVVFAGSRLVVAVPAASPIRALGDLERPGVKLVVGDPDVPVGSYTAEVLARLPAAAEGAILANVRSREPDVAGVVAKLVQGAADAGFVYATDVRAAGDRLRSIELPARLEPRVRYGAAVVRGSSRRARARDFVAGLRSGAGRRALARAGFDPPPP